MSSYMKRISRCRSDDTMDDETEDKDDTKRKSRNLSEKKRRDQFNLLVNELSTMVSTGARKMDKSTVLKATISFLRNHNEVASRSRAHEIQEDWKPTFLSNEEFTHLILEAVDGFIIVFSANGHVHYVSESVTTLLGHLPAELLNVATIYDLLWEEERTTLYQALADVAGPDGQLTFQAHMRRGERPVDQDETCYELINFAGYVRTNVRTSTDEANVDEDQLLFVGTGRLHTPQLIREMSIIDSAKSEFTSRHSLEWKFLFLDHRAPPIIGYLPFEVLGTSGYDYYHVDDLDNVVSCHETLMQKGEGTSCYYRFLTKGQQWIWLQTRFYITYHQWNSKPEFIVCTHRVINHIDALKRMRTGHTSPPQQSPSTLPTSKPPALPTSKPSSGTSSPWGNVSHRTNSVKMRPNRTQSDCTSMSADSPASKHSGPGFQRAEVFVDAQVGQHSMTPQFIAAIPVQSVLAEFQSSSVVPSIPQQSSADNIVISGEDTSNLQAQLQRKHAELQAIIGQQQAELRRVSEQLLMARLGLFTSPTPQPQQQQLDNTIQIHTPYVCNSSGVSSTSEHQQQQ